MSKILDYSIVNECDKFLNDFEEACLYWTGATFRVRSREYKLRNEVNSDVLITFEVFDKDNKLLSNSGIYIDSDEIDAIVYTSLSLLDQMTKDATKVRVDEENLYKLNVERYNLSFDLDLSIPVDCECNKAKRNYKNIFNEIIKSNKRKISTKKIIKDLKKNASSTNLGSEVVFTYKKLNYDKAS